MHIADVSFEAAQEGEDDESLIDILTSAWRSNGQVLGREFPFVFTRNRYRTFLMLPHADSLASHHDSHWVTLGKARLMKAYFQAPKIVILGEDPFSAEPCSCSKPGSFILYTTYSSLESPLRCGDCFRPVPLYVIPRALGPDIPYPEIHDQLMPWHSDYQSCDTLQMNCSTGEKFGLGEISHHDSSLSRRGRGICEQITQATGTATYYYLHRYRGRGRKSEKNRKCLSCGGEWLLTEQKHEKFDFQCNRCHLLSNIALSIR